MKRHARTLFLLLGLLVVQPACSASPLYYAAEAIEARVVDADTKQPLEGVIVTANWQLFHSTVGGRVPGKQLMVMEAVTDKDGKFTFPAWGPKLALWGYLDNRDPQLLLFKPGHEYRGLQNPTLSTTDHSTVRRSMWNGKTIELKPLKGVDIEAQYKNLLNFSKEVDSFATWHVDPCQWTNLPIVINKMLQERKQLEAQGAHSVMDRTLDRQLLEGEPYFIKQCGEAAKTVIERLKQ